MAFKEQPLASPGSAKNTGLIQVKEEGWTGFSEGWQGCSEGFIESNNFVNSVSVKIFTVPCKTS